MTETPVIPGLAPQEDYVDGPSTDALLDTVIEYRYTRGNHYRLMFDDAHHVTFELLAAPTLVPGTPTPPPPTLDYRAREIRDGLVLLHWIVKGFGIHVCLTIDFPENRVHAAAMMPPNRWEFFDTAEILSVERGARRDDA